MFFVVLDGHRYVVVAYSDQTKVFSIESNDPNPKLTVYKECYGAIGKEHNLILLFKDQIKKFSNFSDAEQPNYNYYYNDIPLSGFINGYYVTGIGFDRIIATFKNNDKYYIRNIQLANDRAYYVDVDDDNKELGKCYTGVVSTDNMVVALSSGNADSGKISGFTFVDTYIHSDFDGAISSNSDGETKWDLSSIYNLAN